MTYRRARLTAGGDRGGRVWAREPYDPDRDPDLLPDTELERAAMATDHTLTPADIADRCRILGSEVSTTSGGARYRIVPPADVRTHDGERPRPVFFDVGEFRGRDERVLTIRNLRMNGLDVTAERDWSNPAPDEATEPAPEIPDMGPIPGKRPSLTYSLAEAATRREPERPDPETPEEIVAALAAEIQRAVGVMTAEVTERLDKLDARVDALENRPVSAAPPSQRLGQLDESVGSLARRVATAEDGVQQVAEGLNNARKTISRLDQRTIAMTEESARAAERIERNRLELHERVDGIDVRLNELGSDDAPAEPRLSRTDELAEAALAALILLPAAVSVSRATVADMIGSGPGDMDLLSKALERLHEAGKLTRTGTRGSTRWRAVREDES